MRKWMWLLLAVGSVGAQGGRDQGTGKTMLFVRWDRSSETGDIWSAAWSALEPHFVGTISRQRLAGFDGDPEKARKFFARFPGAACVVALDAPSAAAAREWYPRTVPVLEASPRPQAQVVLRVPRERLASLVKKLHPGARTVGCFGEDKLPGFETKRCAVAADARGCDLIWIPEGAAWPDGLDPAIPTVSTAATDDGRPVLRVRPDAVGAGQKAAALVLHRLRDAKPFGVVTVSRLHVTVDLDAAHAAGYVVPLALLARADAVRRGS